MLMNVSLVKELVCLDFFSLAVSSHGPLEVIEGKVDRGTANHSLSSTACQGTSNIPFPNLRYKRLIEDRIPYGLSS